MEASVSEQTPSRDTMLTATHWLLTAMLWVSAGAAAVAFALIPLSYAMRHEAELELVATHFRSIAALLALGGVATIIAFVFVRLLRRIVGSVAAGDPFVPANADRLRKMAWLTIAYQVVQVPLSGLIIWFDSAPAKSNVHYGDESISPAIIAMALILFILARVFRQGALMRDELEGTI
jgi:hypothetical protein